MKIVQIESNIIFRAKELIVLAVVSALFIGIAVSAGRAAVPVHPRRAKASPVQSVSQEQFRGEILPDPDTGDAKVRASSYGFYDEARITEFSLDDTQTKKTPDKYVGDRVEITGTLDVKSNTIHVESIKAIGW